MNIQEAYKEVKKYSNEVYLTEVVGCYTDDVDGVCEIGYKSLVFREDDVVFRAKTWEEIIEKVETHIANERNEERLIERMMAV